MVQEDLCVSKIWQMACERLRSQSEPLYRQWFSHVLPLSSAGGKIRLGVPDDFFGDMLNDNYGDLIREALSGIDGVDYDYVLEPGYSEPEPVQVPEMKKAVPPPPPPVSPSPAREKTRRWQGHEYTFENFIVGDENRLAFAAARAAAEEPGTAYNPLFLYGTNGVGKTHLLQAVAAEIRRTRPELVICNTTCDELLNDYYELLLQHRSFASFRAAIREADVLLIDDIHRLAKKTAMQEEFFNLFNVLYSQNKQIVFTSDRQPCEIDDLDKRLSTRFEQGMVSEVGMPEFEARLVVLRMWRNEILTPTPLADEFLEFLAENISSSMRRLKSSFLRLATHASLSGNGNLTMDQVEDLLHAQLSQENASRDIQPDAIQRAVANHFGITINDILGSKRTRQIAEPRMIAMSLCRELTKLSSTEVGKVFGRTHAAVLHAETQVEELCREDEKLRRSMAQLKRQLQKH